MATVNEIKSHIQSVKNTLKITNAMYLISSAKVRKAKQELDDTRPYFDYLLSEIKKVFRHTEDVDSIYFYPADGAHEIEGYYAYLVITSDKGLAGAYNMNVIKETLKLIGDHKKNKIFVVGDYGRHYFSTHNIPIEEDFYFPAHHPTMHMAREIGREILFGFESGNIKKVYVIYTDFKNGLNTQTEVSRLLPFHRAEFISKYNPDYDKKTDEKNVTFYPSEEVVLNKIMPSYFTGFIYSALTDSYCSEHNSRMVAMDNANGNAKELLEKLQLEYNHVRQGAITREITEISAGAMAQKRR